MTNPKSPSPELQNPRSYVALQDIDRAEYDRRQALSNHEAMIEAERLCVPCKLCGGAAKITDAGTGWGYYIRCENSDKRTESRLRPCMISETRISGWAFNVMDMWNRLHSPAANHQLAALEEIKYLCCTAGAPGHIQVSKALARMLAICNRAGVTKKLDELRPIYGASSEVK